MLACLTFNYAPVLTWITKLSRNLFVNFQNYYKTTFWIQELMLLVSFSIFLKLWSIFSCGFRLGPKPKMWFQSYSNFWYLQHRIVYIFSCQNGDTFEYLSNSVPPKKILPHCGWRSRTMVGHWAIKPIRLFTQGTEQWMGLNSKSGTKEKKPIW